MPNNRGYAFLVVSVFLWLLALVLLFQTFLYTPYLGGKFRADVAQSVIVLESVDRGGPLEMAGLEAGTVVTTLVSFDGARIDISGREAILGRHQTPDFNSYNETVRDKERVWQALNGGALTVIDEGGREYLVQPDKSPDIFGIHFETHLKMMLALIVTMVAVGIWVFATPSYAVNMLALSGLGLSANMICGAFLSLSEITIAPLVFHAVISVASWGGACFAFSLLTVIWHFPRPISRWPVAEILIGIGIFLQLNIVFQWQELPLNSFEIAHLIPAPFAVLASAFQWVNTRGRPVERASVVWFSMTIYGLVCLVLALYSLPVVFDAAPLLGPAMSNVLLALIFFGIALGTLRYRLFDVHWIWLRVLVWLCAGFIVVGVDVALAYLLNLTQLQILPLALLLAGWVYFPVRNWLIELIFGQGVIKVSQHIPELLERFNSVQNQDEIDGKFVNFLQHIFNANEVASIDAITVERSQVENHGLFLRVPMVASDRSVQLVGKSNGRQLFSGAEMYVADSFLSLVRSIHEGNLREIRRLEEERRRISRDLHDDVGGRILSMIYQAPDQKTAEQARDALQALRETVTVLENAQETKFDVAWAMLRDEITQNLPDVTFKDEHPSSHRVLSAREFVNLKRIVQEVISNAMKYAVPATLVVTTSKSEHDEIVLRFQNQTSASPDTSLSGMRGLANIQSRAEEIGARVRTLFNGQNENGFSLELLLPTESSL